MKISSLQENLKNGLFIVSHIAGKNVNLPILNNVLIRAKGDGIKMITTDLEIGIVCTIRGKIEKEGEYTVESKVLSEYISLLPNKKVDIEQNENKLFVKSDNYKTVIRGQLADDYPLIPQVKRDVYYKTEIEKFKKAISQVIFAVSNSDNRMELTGVLFDFEGENLTMAATDSFRLAEKKISMETNLKEKENTRIIVPAKTLQELIRILSAVKNENLNNEKSEIKFYISDNQILFTVGNIELISRLIEGQYPDYTQIIPKTNETKAAVDKEELVRAVKASSIFSKTGINDVNLDFPLNANKVIISSASSQTGENITEISSQVSGKDNGIVVNYKFLLDGIGNIDGDQIKFEVINGKTPCILRSEKEDGYQYVIMPIKQ